MKLYILTLDVVFNRLGHSEFLGIYDSREKAVEVMNNHNKKHGNLNCLDCYGIDTVTLNETNPVWYKEWEQGEEDY